MMEIDKLSPPANRRFEKTTNTDSVADRLRSVEKASILREMTV
jgi:hypothetical protein